MISIVKAKTNLQLRRLSYIANVFITN